MGSAGSSTSTMLRQETIWSPPPQSASRSDPWTQPPSTPHALQPVGADHHMSPTDLSGERKEIRSCSCAFQREDLLRESIPSLAPEDAEAVAEHRSTERPPQSRLEDEGTFRETQISIAAKLSPDQPQQQLPFELLDREISDGPATLPSHHRRPPPMPVPPPSGAARGANDGECETLCSDNSTQSVGEATREPSNPLWWEKATFLDCLDRRFSVQAEREKAFAAAAAACELGSVHDPSQYLTTLQREEMLRWLSAVSVS